MCDKKMNVFVELFSFRLIFNSMVDIDPNSNSLHAIGSQIVIFIDM